MARGVWSISPKGIGGENAGFEQDGGASHESAVSIHVYNFTYPLTNPSKSILFEPNRSVCLQIIPSQGHHALDFTPFSSSLTFTSS